MLKRRKKSHSLYNLFLLAICCFTFMGEDCQSDFVEIADFGKIFSR